MLVLEKINVRRSSMRAYIRAKKKLHHWRSTVVAVVTDESRTKVLFVTNDDTEFWSFPKGGIEVRDKFSAHQAVLRELSEELRLKRTHVLARRYLGSINDQERTAQTRERRHPHVIGKYMHYIHVKIRDGAAIKPNRAHHVSKACWVSSQEEFDKLPMTRHRRNMAQLVLQEIGISWALQPA